MLPGWQALLWAHLDSAGLCALLHGRLWCEGQTWGREPGEYLGQCYVGLVWGSGFELWVSGSELWFLRCV